VLADAEGAVQDRVELILAQWARERPDLDHTPVAVIGRLSRAARVVERALAEHFATHGLQAGEYDILATLRRSGAPFRLTAGALVGTSMVTSGAITNRIDRLVAKELVDRATDPSNRRQVLITLTDRGNAVVDEVIEHHLDLERRLLDGLTVRQREQLARILRELLVSLGDTVPEDTLPEVDDHDR
jgi:DNA-binding MarR family transcriptional regulator